MLRTLTALLALSLTVLPNSASAQETEETESNINGFFVDRILPIEVTLSARFGLGTNPDEHLVNRADCYRYLGLGSPPRCDGSSSTTDTTGDTGGDTTDSDTVGGDTASGDTAVADTTGSATGEREPPDGLLCDEPEGLVCDSNDIEWECDQNSIPMEGSDIMCGDADVDCGTVCEIACGTCAEGETCNVNTCQTTAQKPGGKADHGTDGSGDPAEHGFLIRVSMNDTAASGSPHVEFGVAFGSSCSTTDYPTGDGDTNCQPVTGLTMDTWDDSWSNIDVEIKMQDFLGESCTTDGERRVYFYIRDGANTLYVHQEPFGLDYSLPTAPTVDEVNAGERNLLVSWSAGNANDTDLTYTIYFSKEAAFTSSTIAAGEGDIQSKSNLNPDPLEFSISPLENDQDYWVGVVAVDAAGNESEICSTDALLTGRPLEVDDFWEYYQRQGGDEEGGFSFCFVATAAFDTPTAPAVTWLREYRDTHLVTNEGGQALVNLYYRVGPNAAAMIRGNDTLKAVARGLLIPLIFMVILLMGWPTWAPLAAAAGLVLSRRLRRRRRKGGSR